MSLAQDEEDGPVEPAPMPTVREARYSRSLERGLAILGCFTPEHPLLGIAELAEKLGMSRPTTHRYVSTLVSLGYLEQDVTRKYRLGLGTIDLGAGLNAMGLCKHAHPHLQELAQRSGFAAEIAVLDGTEILLLDRVHNRRAGQEKPAEVVQARSRLPAYCTSMGKVLLAYLPRGLGDRLISEMDLTKRGPRTITSKNALRAQLEDVQQEGLAINDEELRAGSVAIAAPVREESGDVIAAVSLAAYGGVIEVDELVSRFEGKLVAMAEQISRQLGWRGEEE
jgi:IclR family transcriptional regulator, pca regulon regulatory protein